MRKSSIVRILCNSVILTFPPAHRVSPETTKRSLTHNLERPSQYLTLTWSDTTGGADKKIPWYVQGYNWNLWVTSLREKVLSDFVWESGGRVNERKTKNEAYGEASEIMASKVGEWVLCLSMVAETTRLTPWPRETTAPWKKQQLLCQYQTEPDFRTFAALAPIQDSGRCDGVVLRGPGTRPARRCELTVLISPSGQRLPI